MKQDLDTRNIQFDEAIVMVHGMKTSNSSLTIIFLMEKRENKI